jgi:hypothetical protein
MSLIGSWPVLLLLGIGACADDADEAVKRGVGADCSSDVDCPEEGQSCLDFKGGYCGLEDCEGDDDCPRGSACVTHDDGVNYCFLLCGDKPDCNRHRGADEANCVSSVTFVEGGKNGAKACEPPSG